MEFKYLNKTDENNILNNSYTFSIHKDDLPFNTIIIPIGYPTIYFIFGDYQESIFNNVTTKLSGLYVSGQFNKAFNHSSKSTGLTFGLELHPTALYKMLHTDVSVLSNKHQPLIEINNELGLKLSQIFTTTKSNEEAFANKAIYFINNLKLYIDKDTQQIDKAVDFIFKKEGLLQIDELLKIIAFSQKTLETKFKKIVGLTPGKFIKMIRFSSLMRKYHSKEINLNDLIYAYNFYDKSHFLKEFKTFIGQSPKNYFKEDYPLLDQYLIQ